MPPRIPAELAVIGHVDELVARPYRAHLILECLARESADFMNQFKQGNRVLRTAAHVVDLARCIGAVQTCRFKRAQQVIDAKHVADLAAVTVNENRITLQR